MIKGMVMDEKIVVEKIIAASKAVDLLNIIA